VYRIYFARCTNIFNSLLAQLVKYDVHTTRKINSIHAIFYHILSFYCTSQHHSATPILARNHTNIRIHAHTTPTHTDLYSNDGVSI